MGVLRILSALLLSVAIGCGAAKQPAATLTLATTTSTRDSGLLDVLVPMFRRQTGIEVKVVAVGSGQALELGRRGDADVLLTHAPAVEERFMAQGFGAARHAVMQNDFVVVGPEDDPAKIEGESSVCRAFTQIARAATPFVSRGDESGTFMKERQIWEATGVDPHGDWYVEAGAGMAQALRLASEKRAYTLSDRGTFLSQRDRLNLKILCQGDPMLLNRYSVILLSPKMHPRVHHEAARSFADFLLAPETQRTIAEFGTQKYGEPLFFAVPPQDTTDQ